MDLNLAIKNVKSFPPPLCRELEKSTSLDNHILGLRLIFLFKEITIYNHLSFILQMISRIEQTLE